jgi:ABC-2 type transport system ATP-binding protein
MATAPVLECRGVSKVFRSYRRQPGLRGILQNLFARRWEDFTALDGIELEVGEGEVVGLIGANGAGKTTLVKCLTGIVPVSAGTARVFGHASFDLPDSLKRRLSLVMGQRSQLWWDLPPIDSFKLLQEIYQVPEARFRERLERFAATLDVGDRLEVQLRQLSLGQRMKMEIIGAFLHDPDLVFLDEPTIGLDLVSRETIRRFLVELNREERKTIVLTSHDMEDIEETCQRLVILQEGKLLFDGGLVELSQRVVPERAIEVHLEPGSRSWSRDLEPELEPFGARLTGESPLSLSFSVPAARARRFVQRLFDLFDVRDLNVERQELEGLIRQIFVSRGLEPPAPPSAAPGETP